MPHSKNQMSLDFGRVNTRSASAIACSLAVQLREVLQSETTWQSGAIWLFGESESGHEELAKSWAIQAGASVFDENNISESLASISNKIVILNADCADEQILLSLLVMAETGEIQLLLAAGAASNQCKVSSADLASRLRNLTNLAMPNLTKSLAKQIISIGLKEAGISKSALDIDAVIAKSNLNFVTISKLICFIVEAITNGSRLSKSELSSKIEEFISSQGNRDLFDDK